MTTNRRAEIQRRLSLAPVPKPPAGLADRIKDDIPKELRFDAEKERARLRQGVAFNLRVAASISLRVGDNQSSSRSRQHHGRVIAGRLRARRDARRRHNGNRG